MFVDSSAVVAILARERDAGEFAAKIAGATRPISAGHVVLESSMRLATMLGVEPERASEAILEMFEEAGIVFVAIDRATAEIAVTAFSRFGKGRGGKAQLSFGDCLSYACARKHDAALLFKGGDFTSTYARAA